MVLFRARPERYGHIKPQVHPMVREWDALAELQRAASDLGRAARMAGCLDVPSDVPHADYVSRDAFGDPHPHRLCPAHPAVRDYVVNLCSDLAHGYELAAGSWRRRAGCPVTRAAIASLAAAPLDRWARALLCFAGTTGLAFYDYDHLRRAGLAPVKAAFDALELGMIAPLAQPL